MLETSDLTWMREANEQLLPDTCSILTRTLTPDGAGGNIETWGTASTPDCRVDFESGIMSVAGGGLQPFSKTVLWLPYDTEITTENRVSWGSGAWTVLSVQSDSWMTLTKVEIHAV